MTPLNVSSRSDHATSTPPATIQLNSGMTRTSSLARISRNRKTPSTADSKSAPQVTSCAPRSPITRPKKPAITAAIRGRNTTATANASTLHHVDVLDPDRTAVAEINDEDGEANRRLRRGDGQHEHREGLTDEVVQKNREGDEVDANSEQHQLDRHQHDDDVLAVQKNAEDSKREQDRGHRQIMREADQHQLLPVPSGTLTTSTVSARVRASCADIDCRLTSARCRKVNTIAPIIATNRIKPAA